MRKPSTQAVLELLRARGSHGTTSLDALASVGTFRLGARVWELKAEGFDITSEMVTVPSGARIARYVLQERRDEIRRTILVEEIELGLL